MVSGFSNEPTWLFSWKLSTSSKSGNTNSITSSVDRGPVVKAD
jgi:hypothetical protein